MNSECSLEITTSGLDTQAVLLCVIMIYFVFLVGKKYIFFKALFCVACFYVFFGASSLLWMLLVSIIHCGHTEQLNNRYKSCSVSVQYSHHHKDLISLHISRVFSLCMSKEKPYPEKFGTMLLVVHITVSLDLEAMLV